MLRVERGREESLAALLKHRDDVNDDWFVGRCLKTRSIYRLRGSTVEDPKRSEWRD